MLLPKSVVNGIHWPAIPPPATATLYALQYQLGESEWWNPALIRERQFSQLELLLAHAIDTVPYYRKRLKSVGLKPASRLNEERWKRVALLSKKTLRESSGLCRSERVPPQHGGVTQHSTSGSSGEPMKTLGTELASTIWHALALRAYHWHGCDFSGHLMVIRSGRYEADPTSVEEQSGWGAWADFVDKPGRGTTMYHLAPIERQADVLLQKRPDYLLAYPSALYALARHFQARETPSSLLKLFSYGEPLTPGVRDICREVFGLDVADFYSAEEVGYIAVRCPDSDNYHVQSDSLLVEVLDDDGRPCGPGQVGRIAVTTLLNFAMPLIRYDIGDHARVGGPCPCGRGLPTLTRILGRRRNRVRLPDRRSEWLDLYSSDWRANGDIGLLQLTQRSPDAMDVLVACESPLSADGERGFEQLLSEKLEHPFTLRFSYQPEIPRRPNGKFEAFVNASIRD